MRAMLKAQLTWTPPTLRSPTLDRARRSKSSSASARPEAVLLPGRRRPPHVYAVFDMERPDQIPVIGEPLFQAMGAT